MKNSKKNTKSLTKMVELAIFIAIIVVIQLIGSGIKIGTVSISLVLIPIVVGGMLLGPASGAVLGFVFATMTLIGGISGMDPFTGVLLQAGTYSAIATVIIIFLKGTLAGFLSGLVYKSLSGKNSLLAAILASATAPIVNTGVFIIGCLALTDVLTSNFTDDANLLYFLFIGCAGVNFLAEFLVNVVLSPAIHTFVKSISKGRV